ncbi:MAG: hypothetical protein RL434_2204 [Pseudomonadota bacterium]|jgi:3-oxoacyl-[acyl-carrier protein] reductase
MEFSQQTVVITGGTRGIGRAFAEAFHAAGAQVLVTGTGSVPPADLIGEYQQLDLTDSSSTERFSHYLADRPRVDVLINNAGINIIKSLEELTPEEFDRVARVSYHGPFHLSRAVAPVMRRQGGGRIINLASIWSVATKAKRSAYSAAKTGLVGLTRALAVELAPAGILVNALSPGFTLTELTARSLKPEEMTVLAAQIPLQRMAQPTEIAAVALFLASRRNTYLTGQNLVVDGGFTLV